ncbi:MAG TPA: tyrosine-type recombinase/integrase [Gemmataceae bacterium]|jgi:integrase|nr:tyrosine-type recombinase/integrase [Gemmataceae bacterium]
MKKSSKSADSRKPYPDFPLTKHQTGQWCKKVRGRIHYFGRDDKAALEKWLKEKDYLLAGIAPPVEGQPEAPTVQLLVNKFLTAKQALVASGEMSPRTFAGYHHTGGVLVKFFGRLRPLCDLTPEDFIALRAKIADGKGPHGLGNTIQRVRTIMLFSSDALGVAVNFGRKTFRKPAKKVFRAARAERGQRMFEPEELRRMLDSAKQPLRAMVLLGLNGAFGQSDLAGLPLSALDLAASWCNYPRPKTGIPRRVPLWPETCDAIRQWLPDRPEPKDAADSKLVFVTKYGHRFVRTKKGTKDRENSIDGISQEFRKLVRKLGMKRAGGFYNLRHVFRTIADTARDQPAAIAIMGHAPDVDDMSDSYRERIGDDRLLAVVNVVRNWLFAAPETAEREPGILPFSSNVG